MSHALIRKNGTIGHIPFSGLNNALNDPHPITAASRIGHGSQAVHFSVLVGEAYPLPSHFFDITFNFIFNQKQ